jgi:hypothetical protein
MELSQQSQVKICFPWLHLFLKCSPGKARQYTSIVVGSWDISWWKLQTISKALLNKVLRFFFVRHEQGISNHKNVRLRACTQRPSLRIPRNDVVKCQWLHFLNIIVRTPWTSNSRPCNFKNTLPNSSPTIFIFIRRGDYKRISTLRY